MAIILERFAVDCANVITDNDLHSGSKDAAGARHLILPTLEAFPADTDRKVIAADLMERALSIPSELALADQAISLWWDVVGDQD